MMQARFFLVAAFASASLAACQSAVVAKPLPAWLAADKTTQACIDQMQNFVKTDNFPVLLTKAAFANDDRLVITLNQANNQGVNALPSGNGRMLGAPNSFRLTMVQSSCHMAHEQTGRSTALDACTCIAKP